MAIVAALPPVTAPSSGSPTPIVKQSPTWATTWADIKAAGQAEGHVVFRTGVEETRVYRQNLPEFEKALGFRITTLAGSPTELAAKVVREQRAGKSSADLWFSGASSILNVFM